MAVTGVQVAGVEKLDIIPATPAFGTATVSPVLATGRTIALCGFYFTSNAAGASISIRAGDGTTVKWRASLNSAIEPQKLEFHHPLVMDGLAIVLAGGATYSWAVWYKELG